MPILGFNIISSTCCAKNSSLISCTKTMAKRMQEQMKEENIVAKSRLMAIILSSIVPASSSSAKDMVASKGPGTLTATGKPGARARRNSKPHAASSSQVTLQDAYLGGLMNMAAGKLPRQMKVRKYGNFLNLNPGAIMRRELQGDFLPKKQPQGNLKHPEVQKIQRILKLQKRNGHIFSFCLQQSYLT